MNTLRKNTIVRATAVLLLFVALIGVLALPGMTAVLAQDDSPAKGEPLDAGLTREEALMGGMLMSSLPGEGEWEPNNTPSSADRVYPYSGHKLTGKIDYVGDVDYYTFCLEDETVMVSINAQQVGSGLDSVLTLYEDGTVVAENDDSRGLDSFLNYYEPNWDCFDLKVADYQNAHGGNDHWYELYFWSEAAYNLPSYEPNNTKAKATGTSYLHTHTSPHIDKDGDVDWYAFGGVKGDQVEVYIETTGIHGTLETEATLYNGGKVLDTCGAADWGVNDTGCSMKATLPKTGTYHIKVADDHGKGGEEKIYWLAVRFTDPYEPNDDPAEAIAIEYGQTVRSHIDLVNWKDWYKFYGHAGDIVTVLGMEYMSLYDSDGATSLGEQYQDTNAYSYVLPHDGWYYIEVYMDYWEDYYSGGGVYELTIGPMMLVSTHANGKLGDIAYQKQDLLAYFPHADSYRLYFDGSDVGIKQNVADFEIVDQDEAFGAWSHNLLMTFIGTTKLPYLGTVKAQDVVYCDAWSMGNNTSCNWEMYLDGSDIGLTTGAETIDALALHGAVGAYDLIFSTTGRATLQFQGSRLTAEDEDLVACYLDQAGWDTDAWCWLFFDGTADGGLPASADIASARISPFYSVVPSEEPLVLYLTFDKPVKIDGVTYQPNDIAACELDENDGHCHWQPKYWIGNDHGLKGKKIDGLAWPPGPSVSDLPMP